MLISAGSAWSVREKLKALDCTTHRGDEPNSAVIQDRDKVVCSFVRKSRPSIHNTFSYHEFETEFTDTDRIKWDRSDPNTVPTVKALWMLH